MEVDCDDLRRFCHTKKVDTTTAQVYDARYVIYHLCLPAGAGRWGDARHGTADCRGRAAAVASGGGEEMRYCTGIGNEHEQKESKQ